MALIKFVGKNNFEKHVIRYTFYAETEILASFIQQHSIKNQMTKGGVHRNENSSDFQWCSPSEAENVTRMLQNFIQLSNKNVLRLFQQVFIWVVYFYEMIFECLKGIRMQSNVTQCCCSMPFFRIKSQWALFFVYFYLQTVLNSCW